MKLISIIISVLIITFKCLGQDFRGGEIWFKHIDYNKYEAFFDIYLFDSGQNVKPYLLVCSLCGNVPDTAYYLENIPLIQNISLYRYKSTFVFPQEDTEYPVLVIDTFHLPELKNLEGTYKEFFFLRTTLTTSLFLIFGLNSPPAFDNFQTNYWFDNGTFLFNSGAGDPDGDTLFYGFKNYDNNPYYEYAFPDATDSFHCNPLNGIITWDKPTEPGKYLVGIEVFEYHPSGIYLGRGGRDMIIEITEADIVSSDKEKLRKNEIKICPNPTNSILNISIELHPVANRINNLSIYNLFGQLLHTETLAPLINTFKKDIDVSDWTPGVYLLSIQAGDEFWTEKVVVY